MDDDDDHDDDDHDELTDGVARISSMKNDDH